MDNLYNIINNNYYHWQSNLGQFLYNPDNIAVSTYEKMIDTDETIGSGVELIQLIVSSMLGEYTHKDQKKADFVNDCFSGMIGSLGNVVKNGILTSIWAGVSTTEIAYKLVGSKTMLQELQTLHPADVTFELNQEDGPEKNNIKTVWQYQSLLTQEKALEPALKRIVFSIGKRFGNPYGRSMLKRILKNWVLKDEVLKRRGIACARMASPLPWARTSNLNQSILIDGTTMSYRDFLKRVLNSVDTGKSLITDKQTDIEFIASNISEEFDRFMNYLNKMLFRGLFIPPLIFDGEGGGSFALGKQHFAAFLKICEGIYSLLVDEALIDQLVKPLLELNFGPGDDLGSFQRNQLGEDDIGVMTKAFLDMTNAGYINPQDQDDLNAVRLKMGFAEKEVDDLLLLTPSPQNPALVDAIQEQVPSQKETQDSKKDMKKRITQELSRSE